MAETQPDYEGGWLCPNTGPVIHGRARHFCPEEGCPKGYCARDDGWNYGEPSPDRCTALAHRKDDIPLA